MGTSFNPYREWLGIKSPLRPPDHYTLLNLPRFESDPDKIRRSTDAQKSRIRGVRPGPHAAVWQQLLDQIDSAGSCLLSAADKQAYDVQLRQAPLPGESVLDDPSEWATTAASSIFVGSAESQIQPVTETRPAEPKSNLAPQPTQNPMPPTRAPAPAVADAVPKTPTVEPVPSLASNPMPPTFCSEEARQATPMAAAEPLPDVKLPTLVEPPMAVEPATTPVGPAKPAQWITPNAPLGSGDAPVDRLLPPTALPVTAAAAAAAAAIDRPTIMDSPQPNGFLPGAAPVIRTAPEPRCQETTPRKSSYLDGTNLAIAASLLMIAAAGLIYIVSKRGEPTTIAVAPEPETMKRTPETLGGNTPDTDPEGTVTPGTTDPDTSDPKTTDPKTTDPDTTDAGTPDPDTTDPDTTDAGRPDPKTAEPEMTDAGRPDPKTADPKTADPKTTDPKTTDPKTADPKTADAGRPDPDTPTDSKTTDGPSPSNVLPPLTEEQSEQIEQTLQEAKAALRSRDPERARRLVGDAQRLAATAATGPHSERIHRMDLLSNYVGQFWEAVAAGMDDLAGTDFQVGSTMIHIHEANLDTIRYRLRGKNFTKTRTEMPVGLIRAIGEHWLDKDAKSKIFIGAFLAVEPKYGPAKARQQWQVALDAGQPIADLMPILDELKD